MLSYHEGKAEEKNWIIVEEAFDPKVQGKCESIFAGGNGYIGLRAAHEEQYTGQVKNLFIAGTYNKGIREASAELPNLPDPTMMEWVINGERFSINRGTVKAYRRSFNLRNGELIRELTWVSPKGDRVRFTFKRFVSLNNLHLIAQQVTLTPLSGDMSLNLTSGINGRMTNSGEQHFLEGEKRFQEQVLSMKSRTNESKVDIHIGCTHTMKDYSEQWMDLPLNARIQRRQLSGEIDLQIRSGRSISIEKLSMIHTSMDRGEAYVSPDDQLPGLLLDKQKGYDKLLEETNKVWQSYWRDAEITVETNEQNSTDQLAIHFALYHLRIMTPWHDDRFGIGAKGLTGEGYKGHSFWDSEVFIVPFYTFTFPEIAKQLLMYRYRTLEGARKKAEENGYQGAMFPWESALSGEEETPVWGAINVVTGESTKIWSGFIEQHITGDIALSVHRYIEATADQTFLIQYGYELFIETARFWSSRLEWIPENERYEIHQVIGPDEYKEHINNNAFTNYLAAWNIRIALQYLETCRVENPALFTELNERFKIKQALVVWAEQIDAIYLPEPNDQGIIPQDDTYLQKPDLNIESYKNASKKQTILKDYSRDQVINMQVSKQADVVMLLYLFRDQFCNEVKRSNWDYYERRTIHDSSLSMAVHSILAADMNDPEKAYDCFLEAAMIDLGQNPHSSDEGIHSASLGGIWKMIVFGFLGLHADEDQFRIHPVLPSKWRKISAPIRYKGQSYRITATHEKAVITEIQGDKGNQ